MLQPDQRPKVTIEDLLQLKRAERPADAFWNTFERELRQKQLTALMAKRSWWQDLPLLFGRRAYLPVGATAVLAFTLVSVKFYDPVQGVKVDDTAAPARVAAPDMARQSVQPMTMDAVAAPAASPLVNRHEQAYVRLENSAASVGRDAENVSSRVEVLPMLSASQVAETPSSRSIAANLARLEQSEPELLDAVLGSRLSPRSADRVQNASMQVAELASVPTGPSTRSRLLASYNSDRQLEPEPVPPAILRERHARRLADSELNDRITRVGVRGDQVSLRF